MRVETRLVVVFVVRLVFIGLAVWMVLAPDALPGAHWILRAALCATFLVLSVLVGEMATLHTQFELFIRALRAAGVQVKEEDSLKADREAVAILIRALGSREASTREKAHRNLVRLTGKDFPPERETWEAWWRERQKPAAGGEGAEAET